MYSAGQKFKVSLDFFLNFVITYVHYIISEKQPGSQSTMKRILRDRGLFGRVAAKNPALSRQQIKKRTTYCKQHQDWNINEWSAVIFSDESKIELNPESREYVRRPNNQRYNPRYTSKTVKFGGKSLMVWDAIK